MRILLLRSSNDIMNEMMFRSQRDPDKPPPNEPGDTYIFLGMGVGAIAGGAAGFVISMKSGYGWIPIGSIIGAFLGTVTGDHINKRRRKKTHARRDPQRAL